MKKIIYQNSTLRPCGTVQDIYPADITDPLAWELEYNVIPNFGGEASDYGHVETDLVKFHLENGPNGVVAVDDFDYLEPLRVERNKHLAACDWTQLPDSPLGTLERAEWAEYRQALRDFPDVVDLENVVWPTEPT